MNGSCVYLDVSLSLANSVACVNLGNLVLVIWLLAFGFWLLACVYFGNSACVYLELGRLCLS